MSAATAGDLYIDEPWLLMRWDGDHQCVFAEWKTFATSGEFQGALMRRWTLCGRGRRSTS